MTKSSTKLMISLLLFVFLFCFLGLPFTAWWFNGDDFSGLALGKNMQTLKDFLYHLIHGNVNTYILPSNHPEFVPWGSLPTHQPNFMAIYYRPIQCLYLAITYKFVGIYGYAYYLINVFLHSLNTTILFSIFSSITSPLMAFLWSLFFAFHPQIGFRFGHVVNFQYYVNLTFLLLTILFFKQYLDTNKKHCLICSYFFFTFSLFTRETGIVLPFILIIGSYLYTKRWSLKPLYYAIIALFYLILRLYLYPLSSTTVSTPWLSIITKKYNEFLCIIYDSLGLSWLPYGHMKIRLCILMSICLICLYLFWRNKHKKWILFFACSYLLMLWPSIIGFYSPRYYYEAAPFVLLIFILLTKSIQTSFLKKLFLFSFTIVIMVYGILTYKNLKIREQKLNTIHTAFQSLQIDNRITSGTRPLCFLAFPVDGLGSCIEQAAWLFTTPHATAIYYDPSTILIQADANIIENKTWFMQCSNYYTKNFYSITRSANGVRITTQNPQKINFNPDDSYLSMGPKMIHQTTPINGKMVTTDFSLTFDNKYLQQKPLIIVWDYIKEEFTIIDIFS